MNQKNNFYKIANNEDWNNLKNEEDLVDISNDAYFGFRAMEKRAKKIIYDPFIVNNLVRLIKESKKFEDTIHILIFNEQNLEYEALIDVEIFIQLATKKIEQILEINQNLKIDFKIISERWKKESKDIYDILFKIYKQNIYI